MDASSLDARPFKQLLRLVVRAFYPEHCPPLHYQDATEGSRSRLAKIDTSGLGIVVVDYLLEREWVSEEQMCTDLGQHHKLLRRALKYLEHEHLLMSHSQRETKRTQKRDLVKQAVDTRTAQLQELQESSKAGDDDDDEAQPEKHHTYSYWAVDFPRAFDMVQLRLHVMKRLLKDELDAREAVAQYKCKAPHCGKEYTSFDIMDILQGSGTMECAMCGGVVEQVLATGQTGDEEQRKARRERLTQLLKDLERQLDPILRLVHSLRHTQPPHHGSITDWARAQQARAAGAAGALLPGGTAPGGGPAALRVRGPGGVTQLTEATSAAKSAVYQQEAHVQVLLADGGAAAAGAAGSAAAAADAAAAAPAAATALTAGPALGPAAEAKAPSLQPFFLKGGAAAQQQQAEEEGPPQKKIKTEEAAPVQATGAGEDEEWEDI